MKLSDYLFELRKKEGLTQKQLAHKIGVSRKMVGHYEKGGITPPENVIDNLSKVFGVRMSRLIEMRNAEHDILRHDPSLTKIDVYGENYYINRKGVIYRASYVTVDGRYIKSKIVTQSLGKNGYYYVNLRCDGKTKLVYVHRIMAETYVDNPENKEQVNHINGDKKDNRIENLEWVTPKENTQHSIYNGMTPIGEKAHKSKLTLKEAVSIKLSNRGNTELAKEYGVSRAQVYRIKKGLNWSMAIANYFDELEEVQ